MKNTTSLKATKKQDMNNIFFAKTLLWKKSMTHEGKMEDPGTGTNRDAAPGAP
ncbi:hypothetical protein [Enterobacter hormaechei]|uniref:hypothetical protein n=1 Tax=Enterobacter hormaechei TaxID=158836 RepID=UPI0035107BCA